MLDAINPIFSIAGCGVGWHINGALLRNVILDATDVMSFQGDVPCKLMVLDAVSASFFLTYWCLML